MPGDNIEKLSDSEQAARSSDSKKDKKKDKKKRNSIGKWFRELRAELKKVVWPTKKQTANQTGVSLLIMLISSLVIWGFDQMAAQIVHALMSLAGK